MQISENYWDWNKSACRVRAVEYGGLKQCMIVLTLEVNGSYDKHM